MTYLLSEIASRRRQLMSFFLPLKQENMSKYKKIIFKAIWDNEFSKSSVFSYNNMSSSSLTIKHDIT